MPNETTSSQEDSLEHSDSQESQLTSPENTGELEAADAQEESESSVPEKFVGKSAAEIIASYQQLEKRLGQLGSEKSNAEKLAQENASRVAQYEAYVAGLSRNPSQPQPTQSSDPLTVFEQAWENEGPKEAIKKLALLQQQGLQSQVVQRKYEDTQAYVQRLQAENPDFAELMPEMQKVAAELEPALSPDVRFSRQAVDMTYQIARARNLSKYAQAEAAKVSAATEITKTKKRQSVSESSSGSKGEVSKNFSDLSLDEMRKALGYVEK